MTDLLSQARRMLEQASVVVPHTDADGLGAGAIALRARGEGADRAVLLGRGETPWAAALPGGVPAILDWGVRGLDGPALIVDHHVPEVTEPGAGQVILSAHGEQPEISTAPLMRRLVPEAPPWLAAIGAFGDLGTAGLALPECAGVPKTAVRKLTPLINAPRRLPDGPVRTALALLVEHVDPREALADPRIAELEAARDRWRAELDRVVRTAPQVGDRAALVLFSSDCQVHPLVATTWARRLAPRIVISANAGYIPGRVNFSVRGGGDANLVTVLREALPDVGGEFAHGHPRATGGSLDPSDFDRLLPALGLQPSVDGRSGGGRPT